MKKLQQQQSLVIYIYIYVCICMYVCMHVCMYVHPFRLSFIFIFGKYPGQY